MSKYKPGDKFEIEVISESEIAKGCYLTKAGIIPEGMLDMLKKIEPEEPEVDWSKVEVDTPVLVSNVDMDMEDSCRRRYFAKYENGKIYVWRCGATSWSAYSEDDMSYWEYAKLAEVE